MQNPEGLSEGKKTASDFSDKSALSVEVMKALGLVSAAEVDEFSERLENDYLKLSEVCLPDDDLYCLGPQERLKAFTVSAVCRAMGDRVKFRSRRSPIWTDDTVLTGSANVREMRRSSYFGTYTEDMLCNARATFSNGTITNRDRDGSEERVADLFHFTNTRYCDSKNYQGCQMDLVTRKMGEFEVHNREYQMYPIDEADFVIIAMQRALEGRTLPVSFGKMRLFYRGQIELPFRRRGPITAYSYNGKVVSFDWDSGSADPNRGVGLTIGINGKLTTVTPAIEQYYQDRTA